MNPNTSQSNREIALLRHQAGMVHQVVRLNTDGVSQAESLIQPQPGGNCMNWVVGHLLAIYNQALPLVHQEPIQLQGSLDRYNRGSTPVERPEDALDISELMTAWNESCARFDAGLAALSADELNEPAPMSPTDNPNETIGSLLSTVSWHQAYHAGQTGILRRMAGKEGAIR
jgi:hypothetical protein